MQVWGLTDIGLVRRDNQDSYRILPCPEAGSLIAVVCDGMGGVQGGSVASATAAEVFVREVQANLRSDMSPEQIRQVASYAAAVANRAIRERAEAEPAYRGMGTTLVSAVSYHGGAVISNVGDSRAYFIGAAGIRRVSKDHSLVERLVDLGDITEEEARRHPKRNYITRALGPEEHPLCDGFLVPMEAGEYILLCTDGLVGTVTDQEMFHEVWETGDPAGSLVRLLGLSKRRGAPDNVTAVLLRME